MNMDVKKAGDRVICKSTGKKYEIHEVDGDRLLVIDLDDESNLKELLSKKNVAQLSLNYQWRNLSDFS